MTSTSASDPDEEDAVREAVDESASNRRIDERGLQRRLADERDRLFDFVEKLETEEWPLSIVVLNGKQHVCVRIGRQRRMRTLTQGSSGLAKATLAKQGTLGVGDWEPILVSNNPIPQGPNVTNFVFCRQVVETGRRKR